MDTYHPAFEELARQIVQRQQERNMEQARAASTAAQSQAKAENETPTKGMYDEHTTAQG